MLRGRGEQAGRGRRMAGMAQPLVTQVPSVAAIWAVLGALLAMPAAAQTVPPTPVSADAIKQREQELQSSLQALSEASMSADASCVR